MELIVISDPVYFKGECSLINQLFEAGMPVFHLRKESINKLQYSKLIAEIDEVYHDRIALHQFHELILDFPLIKRVHYPERLRKETIGWDLPHYADGRILSTSIHHLNEREYLKKGFDYAFYGPVFNSLSKPGYQGITKYDFVLPKGKDSLKLIALGGINAERIDEVKQMGFDGLGLLGAIWNNQDKAVSTFKLVKDKCC